MSEYSLWTARCEGALGARIALNGLFRRVCQKRSQLLEFVLESMSKLPPW